MKILLKQFLSVKNGFIRTSGLNFRSMQISARVTKVSTHAVESAKSSVKYNFLTRQKKTLHPDDHYLTNPYYNKGSQIDLDMSKKNALTAHTDASEASEITRHIPYVKGVKHPYNIPIPSCNNRTCENKFPCFNPYCEIQKISSGTYSTHFPEEPWDKNQNKPVYACGKSNNERMGRYFQGRDANGKPEYAVVLKEKVQLDPRSLTVTPSGNFNKNPERGAKILEVISYIQKDE